VKSTHFVSSQEVIVTVWLGTEAGEAVEVETILGKVLWDCAFVVGILGLLFEFKEG
jgi:hypothetical protein